MEASNKEPDNLAVSVPEYIKGLNLYLNSAKTNFLLSVSEVKEYDHLIIVNCHDENDEFKVRISRYRYNAYLKKSSLKITSGSSIYFRGFYVLDNSHCYIEIDFLESVNNHNFSIDHPVRKEEKEIINCLDKFNVSIRDYLYDFNGIFSHKNIKISVLTAKNSKAFNDFFKKINAFNIESKYIKISYRVYDVSFSKLFNGKNTEHLASALNDDSLLVFIVRGGGDLSDLASLVTYDFIKLMANAIKPIITGIGHVGDKTLVDDFAYKDLCTPTGAADWLVRNIKGHINKSREAHKLSNLHKVIDQKDSEINCLKEQVYDLTMKINKNKRSYLYRYFLSAISFSALFVVLRIFHIH